MYINNIPYISKILKKYLLFNTLYIVQISSLILNKTAKMWQLILYSKLIDTFQD